MTGTLEAESGFNDAPVVILVVAFSQAGHGRALVRAARRDTLELAIGAAIGLAVGWLGSGARGMWRCPPPASTRSPSMAIA